MDKLRDMMEAAIRDHWHERSSPLQPRNDRLRERQLSRSRGRGAAASPPAVEDNVSVRRMPVSAQTLARNCLVAALPKSLERQTYCLLQAEVLRHLAETGKRSIGVTSPNDGCGKTLTAVNLAISIAVDARRPVMLIDFDLRRPRVHTLFDIEAETGVEDCLFNSAVYAEAIFSPSIDRLTVLPARGSCTAFGQVMRSTHLRMLLDNIKSEHADELLIIDLPSTASERDAQCYEALVDGIVLVVEDDVTESADYRRALNSFDGRKLIGTVLNRVAA